jgi:tyrosyl-tRNA synthetase
VVSAGTYKLAELLTETGLAASKGEARRLIEQGGVKINGDKATAANGDIEIGEESILFQVGKRRFLKILAGTAA